MSDLTDREAEMMRVRGWVNEDGWRLRDLSRSYIHTQGGQWWEEDLREVREELRVRTPYQQGFWDAEKGRGRHNLFEEGSEEWDQYELGSSDYWSAVSEMNEMIDDYLDREVDEE